MKVTVIPMMVRALGTVSQKLEKRLEKQEIRRRIETIAVLKSAIIHRSIK